MVLTCNGDGRSSRIFVVNNLYVIIIRTQQIRFRILRRFCLTVLIPSGVFNQQFRNNIASGVFLRINHGIFFFQIRRNNGKRNVCFACVIGFFQCFYRYRSFISNFQIIAILRNLIDAFAKFFFTDSFIYGFNIRNFRYDCASDILLVLNCKCNFPNRTFLNGKWNFNRSGVPASRNSLNQNLVLSGIDAFAIPANRVSFAFFDRVGRKFKV